MYPVINVTILSIMQVFYGFVKASKQLENLLSSNIDVPKFTFDMVSSAYSINEQRRSPPTQSNALCMVFFLLGFTW